MKYFVKLLLGTSMLIFVFVFFYVLFGGNSTTTSPIEERYEHVNESSKSNMISDTDKETGCLFDDGSHSATVNYYNPSTGKRSTYNLDVVVNDCEVTEIDFTNGGRLDESHINATKLDDNGDASITDDRGREFDVHIDN